MEFVAYWTIWLRKWLGDRAETGAALVPYALALAFIAAICIGAMIIFSEELVAMFEHVSQRINDL